MPGPVAFLDHPTEGPERRKMLAELYAAGASRKEMAAAMNVGVDTISAWTHRNDVQMLVTELARQRVNRITRRIDATLEGRVEGDISKMTTEELLKIRKELTPQRLEVTQKLDREGAAQEVLEEFFRRTLAASAPETLEGTATELTDDEEPAAVENG